MLVFHDYQLGHFIVERKTEINASIIPLNKISWGSSHLQRSSNTVFC